MCVFTKPDEYNYRDAQNTATGRPRFINGPHISLKAYPGYVNKYALLMLRKTQPAFCVGYNCHGLAQKLCDDYNSSRVYISNDGSSHDAHQHASLIQTVDHYFLTNFIRRFRVYLDIDVPTSELVIQTLTNLYIPMSYKTTDGVLRFKG